MDKEPRPVSLEFESQTSNSVILEDASKLKNSKEFKRVVLSQYLSKDRCKE